MIRVWSDRQPAGVLDRLPPRGSTFAYDPAAMGERAVSLTMPVRVQSWDSRTGLLPIFEMNLPEGALRERLIRRFSKAAGRFDDLDLIAVVGRSQIGRIRYSGLDERLTEDVPFQSIDEILRARRDGGLFDYLLEQFAPHSGLSGVQPKVLIRGREGKLPRPGSRQSPSIVSATHIVKLWEPAEYPELAANEHFCLSVAEGLGLAIPHFQLSDDGSALVIERFDLEDGAYRGFEDFCVLNGLHTAQKYEGGYESRLFRRLRSFVLPVEKATALRDLFRLFVLNCAIRNGDAHLKNFGVVYDHVQGAAQLAPVYDLITTWAYMPQDPMALTLDGSTRWPDRRRLTAIGQTRAELALPDIGRIIEATADQIATVAVSLRRYFKSRSPEIGARMAAAWENGIESSLELTRGLVPVSREAPKQRLHLARSDEILLRLIRKSGGTLVAKHVDIARETGIPASTVSGAIGRLVARGAIRRDGRRLSLVACKA